MKLRCAALFVLPLLLAGVARAADDAAEAKAIVEKAIKARGQKLDAPETAESWKEHGVMTSPLGKLEYDVQWTFQPPDAYRFDMTFKQGDKEQKLLVGIRGKEAWQSFNGASAPIEAKKLEAMRQEAYQFWTTSLLPLVRDKEFKLSMAPEGQIDGKPVQAVKVARDGQRDCTLFFDRETGLLVKLEGMVPDEMNGWKETKDEAFFSDYKEIGGLKCFTKMKIIRGGKPLIESSFSDQKVMEKADAKLFEKP